MGLLAHRSLGEAGRDTLDVRTAKG